MVHKGRRAAPQDGQSNGHSAPQVPVQMSRAARASDVASRAGRTLCRVDDVQARLGGVSRDTVRRLEARGALPRVQLPGVRSVLYDSADVDRLIEENKG